MESLFDRPLRRFGVITFSAALALFTAIPVLWIFITGFKTLEETYTSTPLWIPTQPTLANFEYVLYRFPFTIYLRNSLIVAIATVAITLTLTIFAGYSFSRYRFPGRTAALFSILASQMFPSVLLVIPLFEVMKFLGLMDTLAALVLSYVTFAIPMCLFLLKSYFDQVPIELDEAARLDGCNLWQTLWYVVLPSILPGIVASGIYVFIAAWDEFVFALTFTNSDSARTLPVGLNMFIRSNEIQWNHLSAMSLLVTLPVLVLFYIMQRRLITGATAGAVKG